MAYILSHGGRQHTGPRPAGAGVEGGGRQGALGPEGGSSGAFLHVQGGRRETRRRRGQEVMDSHSRGQGRSMGMPLLPQC